jgi:type IV pilus assembly protein PilW
MPRGQRGLTVVEMMVGFAVGLFIVGGATKLFVDYLASNRKLLLETRLQQDLRASADLVARDLRRAGYWQTAAANAWVANGNGGSYTLNPYRGVTLTTNGSSVTCPSTPFTATASGDQVTYAYAKDSDTTLTNSTEQRGFKVSGGAMQTINGGNWQSITDTNVLTVSMSICEYTSIVELYETCSCLSRTTCAKSDFEIGGTRYDTRPVARLSEYLVTLNATSATDTSVKRTISETVRLRNDNLTGGASATTTGQCPNL